MNPKLNLILRSKDSHLRTADDSGATWQLPATLDLQRFDRVRLAWFSTVYGSFDADAEPGPNWPPELGVTCQELVQSGSYDSAESGPSRLLGHLAIRDADLATGEVSIYAEAEHNVSVPIQPGSFETFLSLRLVNLLTGDPFPTMEEWVLCLEFAGC